MNDDEPLPYPMVLSSDEGGPYEHEAFMAGVMVGSFYYKAAMSRHLGATPSPGTIKKIWHHQWDLIAMRYGYTTHVVFDHGEPDKATEEESQWVTIGYRRVAD